MRRTTIFSTFPVVLLTVVAIAADDGIDSLITALKSNDRETCLKAIDTLSELGPGASEAVPALTALLDNEDSSLRWHAARTLASIGPGASAAVPSLIEALSDSDSAVRAYAAYALGRIGKPASSAAKTLAEMAFDADELVRRATLRALRSIDPPQEVVLPIILKILEEGDMSVILPAMQSLAEEGQAAVPRLRKAMQNEQARYWACIVLADIGPDAAEAVPEVTKVLADKDPDMRLQALLTLGEIGQASAPAVPTIVKLFQGDEFKHVRYAAAYAMGKIKAKGDAEAALSRAMESDDEFLRTISAWALALTNPEDTALVDRAVRLIVEAFASDDVDVRRAAARAVIEFDVDRDVVGPLLVAALKDKDKTVVGNAVEALAAMGPAALQHVDDALGNRELRHLAILLIARMGPEAASAVGALVDAIGKATQDEDDILFVREAQIALGAIGPGASQAVSALVGSLSSDQDEIRTTAAYALGKIGPAASAAVPKLRDSLRSEDEATKLTSILALLQIQPSQRALLANSAGPMLLQALKNDNMLVRAEAASAIGEFGQASATVRKRAVPQLKRLLEDENELVREAAESALKKLGGG